MNKLTEQQTDDIILKYKGCGTADDELTCKNCFYGEYGVDDYRCKIEGSTKELIDYITNKHKIKRMKEILS